MRKMIMVALLIALFGFSFAGTVVSVGETVQVGGTKTTTTATTTTTAEEPTEESEEEGTSAGLGGLTMENSEGKTINVGGQKGTVTPLGGSQGSDEFGSATFPSASNGAAPSSSGAQPSTGQTTCALTFALLSCAIGASSIRR